MDIKIGDRIVGKKTGTLTPSTVVGALPAKYSPLYKEISCRWDELYPDWRNKNIIYSEFDEPTPPLTLEEYSTNFQLPDSSNIAFIERLRQDKGLWLDYIKFNYLKNVPLTIKIYYPIDDVDLIG